MDIRRGGVLLAVFGLAAISLLLLGYLSLSLSGNAVQDEAKKGAYDTAAVTAVVVKDQLDSSTTDLNDFGQSRIAPLLTTSDPGQLDRVAGRIASLPGYYRGLQRAILVDPNGVEMADTADGLSIGHDLSGLDWYRAVAAGGHSFIAPASRGATGEWQVWSAVPVFVDDRLVAVLGGVYDVDATLDTAVAYTRALGLDLTIVDSIGQVVLTDGEAGFMPLDPRVQASLHGQAGVVNASALGRPVFSAYAPVGGLRWTVIADVPQAGALARIDSLRWAVTLITGALLLVLVGSLLFVHRLQRRSLAGERRAVSLTGRVHALGRVDEAARAVHARRGGDAHRKIVEVARELAGGRGAGLVVASQSGGRPAWAACSDRDLLATALAPGGPVLAAIEQRDMIVGDDLIAVPLVAGDRSLGALVVAGLGIGLRLDDENGVLLRQLAQHAVTALQSERHERDREGLLSELREQHEQLNEANRLKSEFLASMSHELRTPLSAVIGFADLLLEGIDGDLNAEQREDIAQIHSSGNSLLELINEILDLAKIEAGKMTLDLGEVKLAEVVSAVSATMRPLAAAKGLQLETEVPADLTVAGDPLRIRQVVTNLLSNAIKFTSQGGVSVRCEDAGGQVRVLVVDSGVGIPPESQKIVFEEFRQAEAGTTRKYGGTGLGLAIAKKLVELQGGAIGLESAVGVGTTFWFSLPKVLAPSVAQAPVPSAPAGLPAQTQDLVLVVDDDSATRRVIVRRLQTSGFRTVEAGAADGALSLARELHPAAITLDVLMPGVDGWRVLNELKGSPATADIPIVMVSILEGREVALEMGAKAFLAKPFRQRDLVDAVKTAIGHLQGADVLYVDDERPAREMFKRALAAAGARVRAVASGAEALAEVARVVPDAICVDLLMPEMDGFELVARLRAQAAIRRVPIIVLSSHDLDPAEVELLRDTVERFISKAQAQPADICATLRQTINWSRELELADAG